MRVQRALRLDNKMLITKYSADEYDEEQKKSSDCLNTYAAHWCTEFARKSIESFRW